MISSSSTRVRPALIACAALSAALLLVPRAASAAGRRRVAGMVVVLAEVTAEGDPEGAEVTPAARAPRAMEAARTTAAGDGTAAAITMAATTIAAGATPTGVGAGARGRTTPRGGGAARASTSLRATETATDDGNVGVSARTGRYAIVKTDVSPEEAQVYLDGKYIGTADDFDGMPDFLYLGPGKYHLEFRLPNYETFATDLDVTRGQQVHLDQKLKLEQGKSALDQFPPESKGTPLGRVFTKGADGTAEAAPPPPAASRSPARSVPPRSRDDGWSDRDAAPPHERVSEEHMDVRPEPLPRPAGNRARMRFKVMPEDAAVYVDDRYLGAGEDLEANPRGVVTDPGKHTITVTRPGYKTKTVDINVRIGAPVDVVVELEK